MMTRQEFTNSINATGLAEKFINLQKAVLNRMAKTLKGEEVPEKGGDSYGPAGMTRVQEDQLLLNSVGPAAASAAMAHAVEQVKSKYQHLTLNGDPVASTRFIMNDTGPAGSTPSYDSFSGVLRQFLLPRSAYFTFDNVIDPRHQIDLECGYPKFIMPIMYRYMYDRDDVARRVVDIYPDECWAVDPEVYDNQEDDEKETPFEQRWRELCEEKNLLSYLYRIDKLCGIGHYGVLLVGLDDDGKDLALPVEGIGNDGKRLPGFTRNYNILYMRPFDEYLSYVMEYDTDTSSPRYGMPAYYNLVFLDMTIDAAGASIGTRLLRRVHWSRVIHIADNLQSSLVFGTPRQQPVFNRLLDLRKIKGGSAEMFWKGAFPGLSFEIDPRIAQEDDPQFDQDTFRQEIKDYSDGLQRFITAVGIRVKSLAPQVADPSNHVKMQMQSVATHFGVPLRIFFGSEEGRLASSQDKLTWNQRLGKRNKRFTNPWLLRQVVDRFIAYGVLPPPRDNRYYVDWPDLNTPTDEDKANLSLKFTQALSQYVASGVVHVFEPMDFLTMILGMHPSQARKVVKHMKPGSLDKLMKVDPSQGSGVNGQRPNDVSRGQRSGTTGSRPKGGRKNKGISS